MTIEKTECVLSRVGDPNLDPGYGVSVGYASEPEEDGSRRHWLYVRQDLYVELGEPAVVTVTVEPGDRLNADG